MPSAIAAPAENAAWRRFWPLLLLVAAAVLLISCGLNLWRDPYWVLREDPPWTRDGAGASRLLDLGMRRAKPLQIDRLRPDSVLIGSSVVYRGLNPRHLAGSVYNAGLSSLMAPELPVMAAIVRDIGSVRRVAIGLDYFMFTAMPPPPPVRASLATAAGRLEARGSILLSREALEAAVLDPVRGREPGLWHRNGFKSTPDFEPALTRRVHAAQDLAAQAYRPPSPSLLAAALQRLSGLEVVVYLSPMSSAQRRLLGVSGREPEFMRWRAEVAALAAHHRVPLHDLVDAHGFEDFDPERGSSRFWIDNMHFKPEVGRWVLSRIGWL